MPKASRTISARIHRLNGQMQAIDKMINQRRNCEEVLNQISAVIAGLEQVANLVFQTELQRMTTKKKLSINDIDRLIKALNKTT